MIKKAGNILLISLIHFAVVSGTTHLGLKVIGWGTAETVAKTIFPPVFVWLSRILYFPVITLSLFPRHLFPGGMVYIPIALNSLIWGIFIYGIFHIIVRWRQPVSRVKTKSIQDNTDQPSISPKAQR